MSARVNPAPNAPICRNPRRVMPSQNFCLAPQSVSIALPPLVGQNWREIRREQYAILAFPQEQRKFLFFRGLCRSDLIQIYTKILTAAAGLRRGLKTCNQWQTPKTWNGSRLSLFLAQT